MSYYKTISSYDAYQLNIRTLYDNGTPYYMANTDHGHGMSMPAYTKPESIPRKVRKNLVKPGDKVAQVKNKEVNLSKTQKIYGRLLQPASSDDL